MARFIQYSSSDVSAPVLTGQSGSLVAVLDAVLVNGYGTGANTKIGTGWTKPYANTGTTVGCYQQGTGSMFCLSVDDSGKSAALGSEARLFGFDSLTSVDSGSNPFPTTAQGVGGLNMVTTRKSQTHAPTESIARPWYIFADSRSLYMFINSGDTANAYAAFFFGDFYSIKSTADTCNCIISGRAVESNTNLANDSLDQLSAIGTATAGSFIAHAYSGEGTSILASKHGDGVKGSALKLAGTTAYLNPPDSALYMSPVWVCESATSTVRGRMRGLYQICHAITNFTDLSTFSGSASSDFAGKTFVIFKQSGNAALYCMETSDTVETN